jgi:hypothetical protein
MFKTKTIEVYISEHHTQAMTVAAWEVPILQAIHDAKEITLISEGTIDRDVPDPNDEYRRLATRYGNVTNDDGTQGIPFVASVYGQFGVGNHALVKAIQDATVVAAPAVTFDDLLGNEPQVSSVGG